MRMTAKDSLINCWRLGQTTLSNSSLVPCRKLLTLKPADVSCASVSSFFATVLIPSWCKLEQLSKTCETSQNGCRSLLQTTQTISLLENFNFCRLYLRTVRRCQIAKSGELRLKQQFDRANWPVPMLGDNDFSNSPIGRIRIVVLVAVEHDNQVSILLN